MRKIRGEEVFGDDIYIPEEYIDEEWELARGPGQYYVSTKGRVWSTSRHQFIKPKRLDDHGHVGVGMSYKGHVEYRYLHRMMAEAFIPNPHDYPEVRHLDDDPTNNDVENLAWGTRKDNMRDCIENGHFYYLTDEDRKKSYMKSMERVKAVNLTTGEKLEFESQNEAGRQLGIPQANIWKVLHNERRMAGGYSFERVED